MIVGIALFITVVPFLYLFINSIKLPMEFLTVPPTIIPTKISWEHYQELFFIEGGTTTKFLINSIVITVATKLKSVFIRSLAAYSLARLELPFRLSIIIAFLFRVFSMDGDLAKLDQIVALADTYDAAVMVDDSHATGVLGPKGRGIPAHFGVADRVEIVTSTLGKTLGGATGGFTSGKREIIELLRQRSRPYLFSNSLPPAVAAGALRALDLVAQGDPLRHQLHANATFFRAELTRLGFRLVPGEHPIIPVMLGEATLAASMAEALLQEGVWRSSRPPAAART